MRWRLPDAQIVDRYGARRLGFKAKAAESLRGCMRDQAFAVVCLLPGKGFVHAIASKIKDDFARVNLWASWQRLGRCQRATVVHLGLRPPSPALFAVRLRDAAQERC